MCWFRRRSPGMRILPSWRPTGDAAKVEKGKTVFTAQKCSLCHSIAGKGNAGGGLPKAYLDALVAYLESLKK